MSPVLGDGLSRTPSLASCSILMDQQLLRSQRTKKFLDGSYGQSINKSEQCAQGRISTSRPEFANRADAEAARSGQAALTVCAFAQLPNSSG